MINNDSLLRTPYLRSSRVFPLDGQKLNVELSKSYIDIASSVNKRVIGIFPTNKPIVTGETWFLSQNKIQQTLRQVYVFGTILAGASLSIPYTINGSNEFTRIFGTCDTAVPDSRPIPYASTLANSNIGVRVDTVNFVIIISNGTAAPTINSGLIVLENLSLP